MKTIKAIALALGTMAVSGVQAGYILDFASMADKAYANGSSLNIGEKGFQPFIFTESGGAFTLTIYGGYVGVPASGIPDTEYAYLDKKHAGLGVCGELTPGRPVQSGQR